MVPLLEVHSLGKTYRKQARSLFAGAKDRSEGSAETVVLKDISFSVTPGKTLGVIGRNGAGKSTLLKILAGITRPSSGRAILRGQVSALLEVGTGFHRDLTGRENIFFNGMILGMSRKEIQKKFDQIVDFSEIERSIDEPAKTYSSGMFVRLAFAIAAHLESPILLLDEVLAVGDYRFQRKCLEKAEDLSGEGRAVVLVSHDLGLIQSFCNESLLLEGGRQKALGPTSDVIQIYTKEAETTWQWKAKSIRSGQAFLKSVELQHPSIPYEDPVKIEIVYQVSEPIEGLVAWIGLRTWERTPLFASADTDAAPQLLGSRTPGQYKARVTVPGAWLSPGRYELHVSLSRPDRGELLDSVEVLSFTIVDSGAPGGRLGQSRRGVLRPRLDWNTQPAVPIDQ